MAFEQEIKTLRGTATGLKKKSVMYSVFPGESGVVTLTERERDLLAQVLEVIASRLSGLVNPNVERAMNVHGVTLGTLRLGSDPRQQDFRIDEPSLNEVQSYVQRDWGKTVS